MKIDFLNRALVLSAIVFSPAPGWGQSPPAFTRVVGELLGGAQGIAWGDANGDGWIDVYFAQRSSSTSTLFMNRGNGTFVRAAGTIGANLVNPIGATWGDSDNKGSLDLLISMNNGGNEIFLRNKGDGTFTNVMTGPVVTSGRNSNGGCWGDYDRDGWLDLYVANNDGTNFLFHNNGNGTFTRITTGTLVNGTGNSQGCSWVDYDNDGFPDLYVLRSGAPNLTFHNERNGTFKQVTSGPTATEGGSQLGFAWGDYDNDGLQDLFVANGSVNSLIHNEGGGVFKKVTSPLTGDTASLYSVTWVDYDNDGWLDLFGSNFAVGATCRMYRNNHDGTFTRVTTSPLLTDTGRWFASAWADINNDGFADVLVSGVNIPSALYRNDGNSNHWLTVRCQGRVSNRSAIGAKVRALATIGGKPVWQLREMISNGNTACQNQLDPMFGFGDATVVETLRVEWPSGIVQEIHNVAPNQILTIREPARLEALSRRSDGQLNWTLRGAKDVNYDIEESSNLRTWTRFASMILTGAEATFTNNSANDIRVYRAVER